MLFAAPPDLTNVTPAYKCGTAAAPTICYATDPKTDSLFRAIQSAVNRYAPAVGFSPVQVDGKLGSGTVAALQKIAQSLLADPMTAAVGVGLTPQVVTKETVARGAQSISTLLTNGFNILQLPPVAAPTAPTAPTTTTTTSPALPPPPASMMGGGLPWKWIVGGAAAIAVGYFAFFHKPGKRQGRRAAAAH